MSEILIPAQRTFCCTDAEDVSRLDFFAACSYSTAAVTRKDYIKKGTVNSLCVQCCNGQY